MKEALFLAGVAAFLIAAIYACGGELQWDKVLLGAAIVAIAGAGR